LFFVPLLARVHRPIDRESELRSKSEIGRVRDETEREERVELRERSESETERSGEKERQRSEADPPWVTDGRSWDEAGETRTQFSAGLGSDCSRILR
jgi:hypothetical protein